MAEKNNIKPKHAFTHLHNFHLLLPKQTDKPLIIQLMMWAKHSGVRVHKNAKSALEKAARPCRAFPAYTFEVGLHFQGGCDRVLKRMRSLMEKKKKKNNLPEAFNPSPTTYDVRTQRTSAAHQRGKNKSEPSALDISRPHHFAHQSLSSKGIIRRLQMQMCLNTLPCRHCHFKSPQLTWDARRKTSEPQNYAETLFTLGYYPRQIDLFWQFEC